MFDSFKDSLDRLCGIVDKEVKNMFTTTNSPVWFAVFDRFKTLDRPDICFKEFIKYVNDSLDTVEVNGKLFKDVYKSRNTRDKTVVVGKVDGLITLMYEFLHINENKSSEETQEICKETFISENVGVDKEIVSRDLSFYNETLNDLEENTIKDGSKLLDEQNRLSLLAMMAYSYKEDVDLDEWMENYAKHNNTYFIDQKKNFLHMKEDFEKFIGKKNKKSA